MSKNQEYVEQYAEYAMEQMRRYGIPASVTLAQGICESASTSYIQTTAPTRSSVNMLPLVTHTSTTPSF